MKSLSRIFVKFADRLGRDGTGRGNLCSGLCHRRTCSAVVLWLINLNAVKFTGACMKIKKN